MSIPNKNVDDPSKANLKSEMKYSVPIDRQRGALTRKELPLIGSPDRSMGLGNLGVDQRYSDERLDSLGIRRCFHAHGRGRLNKLDVLQQPSRL